MANKRTDKITEMAKSKSSQRQNEVLAVISEMELAGEKITFYSVQQKTHASKSYLYGNETIRAAIEAARGRPEATRSAESNQVVIKTLKKKIAALEEENRALRASSTVDYKAKYLALQKENEEVKTQLKNAYAIY